MSGECGSVEGKEEVVARLVAVKSRPRPPAVTEWHAGDAAAEPSWRAAAAANEEMVDRTGEVRELCAKLGCSVVVGAGEAGRLWKTAFERECRAISARLAQTRADVVRCAEAYAGGSAGADAGLSESERDAFDARVDVQLREEAAAIERVRQAAGGGAPAAAASTGSSLLAHKQQVVAILQAAAQELTRLVSELQLLRMRQAMVAKKALFVSAAGAKDPLRGGEDAARIERLVELEQQRGSHGGGLRQRRADGAAVKRAQRPAMPQDDDESVSGNDDGFGDFDLDDEELDPESIKVFEEEQVALKAKLDEELLGVKQLERQMHELSQLVTVFNEKLVEQSDDISHIAEEVRTSTGFMGKATKEIDTAREYGSSYRKYIVVFFAVASALLLVLDRMDGPG